MKNTSQEFSLNTLRALGVLKKALLFGTGTTPFACTHKQIKASKKGPYCPQAKRGGEEEEERRREETTSCSGTTHSFSLTVSFDPFLKTNTRKSY